MGKVDRSRIGKGLVFGILMISAWITILLVSQQAFADFGITFTDIAAGDGAGITYRSRETPADALWDELKRKPVFFLQTDAPFVPGKSRGNPGVALFDYDRDGDLDIYVTNSSLVAPNSLYQNLLKETGNMVFQDVAAQAGVEALGHGSTGVCFGDIDNDGDQDLYVLGEGENILFENQGNGVFRDITSASGLGGGGKHDSSCSFGDINTDGLLDVVISNSYDNWNHRLPLMLFEFAHLIEKNQLFLNKGHNVFEEISEQAGIQNVQHINWAVAMVDYDQDGDVDIFVAEDQGPKPPAVFGGQDVGYVRVYRNDGTGHFTDTTEAVGTNRFGAWMGLSFGDLNADGIIDVHATNAGNYLTALMRDMVGGGDWGSGWFLGRGDGTFHYPGVGGVGTTPFGWGTAMVDYDNDGAQDIIFAGGLDMATMVDSNPGGVLHNDGNANFARDFSALPATPYHLRRNVQGLAVGDINNDGFVDLVSVSEMNWPVDQPLASYSQLMGPLGGQFDDATFWPTFTPINPTNPLEGFTWNGIEPEDGTLAVMLSSGNNNKWVKIVPMGSKGLTEEGRVNRDGIGAVIAFKPQKGQAVISPIVSGASHTAAHSLESLFGMGDRNHGTVEILWPGGIKNKLYDIHAKETVVFPEIPCSYTDLSMSLGQYKRCVYRALDKLEKKGVINREQESRFKESAIRAFKEHRREVRVQDGEDRG